MQEYITHTAGFSIHISYALEQIISQCKNPISKIFCVLVNYHKFFFSWEPLKQESLQPLCLLQTPCKRIEYFFNICSPSVGTHQSYETSLRAKCVNHHHAVSTS